MTFVGREKEKAVLERLYGKGTFQMPVIYGRRRIGKTSLIKDFIKNKQTIFFTARETTAQENLRALSKSIHQGLASEQPLLEDEIPTSVFESFEAALDHVFARAKSKQLILVLDEYPYLAQSYKGISSLLLAKIDQHKDSSRLFLVLCGSSMSFMEHQVLGRKSPLYGRRTAQMKLEPFSIFEAHELLADLPATDLVSWYGIVGGVPLYLEQFEADLPLKENIAQNVLSPESFLYGEPDAYLQQELRDPALYNALIRAMASGAGKPSEIADVAGVEPSALSHYMGNLMELGIAEKKQPIIDSNKKKVRYVVADNLFRFWYRFVPSYLTSLQFGDVQSVAQTIADKHLVTFTGPVFEEVCKQWLLRETIEAGEIVSGIGSWWGNDPQEQKQAEIDIVELIDGGKVVFGECKWREAETPESVLETLQHRSLLVSAKERSYYLFSKSSFTPACKQVAKEKNVRLVTLDDMHLA